MKKIIILFLGLSLLSLSCSRKPAPIVTPATVLPPPQYSKFNLEYSEDKSLSFSFPSNFFPDVDVFQSGSQALFRDLGSQDKTTPVPYLSVKIVDTEQAAALKKDLLSQGLKAEADIALASGDKVQRLYGETLPAQDAWGCGLSWWWFLPLTSVDKKEAVLNFSAITELTDDQIAKVETLAEKDCSLSNAATAQYFKDASNQIVNTLKPF